MLSLIFTGGETYYRFFFDATDSFSINKTSQRWFKRHYVLNNAFVRDNIDYNFEIAEGKRRITIFGDSFTAGHGIKSVDDRFANILRKRYPNIEIHVMAKNGANTNTVINWIEKLQSDGYQFDVVALVYCLNDIDYYTTKGKRVHHRIQSFKNSLNFFERNSYFINTLSFRLFAHQEPYFMDYSDHVLDAYSNSEWEQQKHDLIQVKEMIWKINRPMLVISFPFLQVRIEDYAFKEVHKQLNGFWEKQHVPHLDLLPVYESSLGEHLTVNPYDAHPNEFAHRLAAQAMEEYFVSKLQY